MRMWIAATVMALALAGCGKDEPAPKPPPAAAATPPAPKQPEFKSDPKGNLCLACNLRTDGPKCKKCGTQLKAEMPAPMPRPATGEVGKSAVAPLYACPKEGCKWTDAKAGMCFTHKDIQMKVQWFSCAKCGVNEAAAGKCSKCGGDLVKTLK